MPRFSSLLTASAALGLAAIQVVAQADDVIWQYVETSNTSGQSTISTLNHFVSFIQ